MQVKVFFFFFFACAYWMGLLMVLVRALHLRGERDVGTKQGMKIGFVGGFFQLIFLLREDPTEETTNILSVSERKSPR